MHFRNSETFGFSENPPRTFPLPLDPTEILEFFGEMESAHDLPSQTDFSLYLKSGGPKCSIPAAQTGNL